MDMNAAVIDDPNNSDAKAWWFLDTLVVEHRRAPGMTTTVMEMTLPVGHAPALHVHDALDDTWYILEGRMAVRCGDEEYIAEAGNWVSMPRGVPHTFRVVGDHPARILTVHDNSTFRDFVEDLGVETDERVPPPVPSFPPIDELVRVANTHDLRPVGPPMTEDQARELIARVLDRQGVPA
jgi:mannose-6-phosphate isomerase-like protein (cupin superfamily)